MKKLGFPLAVILVAVITGAAMLGTLYALDVTRQEAGQLTVCLLPTWLVVVALIVVPYKKKGR